MIKFFYSPQSSATRVHVALEELGVPYEKVRLHLDKGDQEKPEFLAINPNGKVPALTDGDAKVFESLACLLWLGERHGVEKGLWPKLGTPEHADALSWTVWGNTELVTSMLEVALHGTDLHFAHDKENRSAFVAECAREEWAEKIAKIDKWLAGREWLAGKSFTLADLAVGLAVGSGKMMCNLPVEGANVGAWVGRVTTRPAFARVMANGG
jgi:glutathione S-transferase